MFDVDVMKCRRSRHRAREGGWREALGEGPESGVDMFVGAVALRSLLDLMDADEALVLASGLREGMLVDTLERARVAPNSTLAHASSARLGW